MKKLVIFGAALTLFSTPAFADTSAWAGASVGYNVDGGGVTAMATAGVDTDISKGAFIGIGIGAGESGGKDCLGLACVYGGRELTAELRLGGQSESGWKYYAIGGYSNLKLRGEYAGAQVLTYTSGGITGGVGVEAPIGSKAFTRLEFRYTDYGEDGHATSILPTIGIKF